MGVIVSFDSIPQLYKTMDLGPPRLISNRVNPQVGAGHHRHVVTGGEDSKFGFYADEAIRGFEAEMEAGVREYGVLIHIGSGITDAGVYSKPYPTSLK